MKINFGVKKEISRVFFQCFGEMGIIGCLPRVFDVDFDDKVEKMIVVFKMILQDSTLGHMKITNGNFTILYETIEDMLERGDAWYVGNELWHDLEILIKRDVKWLVEGDTATSITDEEMEEKVKKNKEKNEN